MYKWQQQDSNPQPLSRKRTLNHLAKLAKLKLQIWCLLRARISLTFRQTIECGFTLKLVRDMIITHRQTCSKLIKTPELRQ